MPRPSERRAVGTGVGNVACRICGGAAALRYAGAPGTLAPDDLSPTSHPLGTHADILRCRECGGLQQPALAERTDLTDLYRDMRDEAYLSENLGRRRTAERLLDLVGAQMPGGRLLDVGAGHGLMLDEARRRGYETIGLEVSMAAAAFARDSLGLDVRETTIEALDDAERFDVITLVDVLEHLPDPPATIARCRDLLGPGGLLCVVTPDPSSLTARMLGRRWWALVPAHTYLIPRRTLLELLAGSGLAVVTDVPYVRTFSVGYWFAGLAERSRRLARPGGALARAIGERVSLSLPLGDERVILATRVQRLTPARPLVKDRGGAAKVHVVLPAYNAAKTIPEVARRLPTGAADRALLVDDASTDETSSVALREGFEVIRHPSNRGYGANQKTCYVRAALDGADVVVMVHADSQYDPALIGEMAQPIVDGHADVVIGSRLLEDKAIIGGMPRWKWLGNRLLTAVENRVFRRDYSEYHTGYRAYSVEFLRTVAFLRNSDGFVFDQEIFAQIVHSGARVTELPIPTKYFLEASSVSFAVSVDYGLRTLWVLARFRAHRRLRCWALLRAPAAHLEPERDAQRQMAGDPAPR